MQSNSITSKTAPTLEKHRHATMLRQREDAGDNPTHKRVRALQTTMSDLPEELVGLVLSFLKGINYLQFKMLRCHPKFQRHLDGRFLVLKNHDSDPLFFSQMENYKGTTVVENGYLAIAAIEEFQTHYRTSLDEVTVYFEFAQVRGWKHRSNMGNLVKFCHEKGIHLVIFDKDGDTLNGQLKDVRHVDLEVILNVKKEAGEFNTLLAHRGPNCTLKFYRYPAVVSLRYRALPAVDNFLDMNGVVWNYTIRNMRVFKLYHQSQKILVHCLHRPLLQFVKELVILKSGNRDVSRPRDFMNLDMPKLEKLNILGCHVGQFTDNSFPNLKLLAIEGRHLSDDKTTALKFRGNSLPKLEVLDISVSSIVDFTSDKGPLDNLSRFRLDTDFSGMYGTMEYLFDTFCRASHLSVVPRGSEAPEMMELFMGGLHDCSKLQTLLIADHTDDKWLEQLEKKHFPELRNFYYYNAKQSIKLLPQLMAPHLQCMVLFNTKLERVVTRGYRGPLQLFYTTADGCKPDAYCRAHFNGDRYETRECHFSEHTIEWMIPASFDSNILTRKMSQVDLQEGEPYKFGVVDLRYHECQHIRDATLVSDPFLIDFEGEVPVQRPAPSSWWY